MLRKVAGVGIPRHHQPTLRPCPLGRPCAAAACTRLYLCSSPCRGASRSVAPRGCCAWARAPSLIAGHGACRYHLTCLLAHSERSPRTSANRGQHPDHQPPRMNRAAPCLKILAGGAPSALPPPLMHRGALLGRDPTTFACDDGIAAPPPRMNHGVHLAHDRTIFACLSRSVRYPPLLNHAGHSMHSPMALPQAHSPLSPGNQLLICGPRMSALHSQYTRPPPYPQKNRVPHLARDPKIDAGH